MDLTYEAHRRAHVTFERILRRYGRSPFHEHRPRLVLIWEPDFDRVGYGWYQDGEVGVNFACCDDWVDVVGTLIHETWHHHQDPNRKDEKRYEKEAGDVVRRDLESFLG